MTCAISLLYRQLPQRPHILPDPVLSSARIPELRIFNLPDSPTFRLRFGSPTPRVGLVPAWSCSGRIKCRCGFVQAATGFGGVVRALPRPSEQLESRRLMSVTLAPDRGRDGGDHWIRCPPLPTTTSETDTTLVVGNLHRATFESYISFDLAGISGVADAHLTLQDVSSPGLLSAAPGGGPDRTQRSKLGQHRRLSPSPTARSSRVTGRFSRPNPTAREFRRPHHLEQLSRRRLPLRWTPSRMAMVQASPLTSRAHTSSRRWRAARRA